MEVRIIKNNLTEEEAYREELNLILHYINNGYGIDIPSMEGNNPNKFLTNQTFGTQGSIGISNPMYGVSPRERMSDDKYEEWLEKTSNRLKNQTGENNPNWKNNTLHNRVKDNPSLRKKYYARPGSQNGRCRKVELYDLNGNYIKTFDYIGECAEYVKNVSNARGHIDSIRSNIRIYSKNNKPFLGFKYNII